MTALCRAARHELLLARELAIACETRRRKIRRGYVRALKDTIDRISALLETIEREAWGDPER
jgi:hypothetical protein